MFMADEDCSMDWLASLCNFTISQGRIPDDWKSTILIPVCKGKGDPVECGSYITIKLLEDAMKVIDVCSNEGSETDKVKIDAMQFKPVKELLMQSSQYGRL